MSAIYSNGGNRWNILGFNFTKRDALSSLYKISIYCTYVSVYLWIYYDCGHTYTLVTFSKFSFSTVGSLYPADLRRKVESFAFCTERAILGKMSIVRRQYESTRVGEILLNLLNFTNVRPTLPFITLPQSFFRTWHRDDAKKHWPCPDWHD
jgi:hypothetical protein